MAHALIHIDGASKGNPGPAGIGIVISDDRGTVLKEIGENIGEATNNVAEYTALIRALEEAQNLDIDSVSVRTDSELLAKQINGLYKVKNEGIQPLYNSAKQLINNMNSFSIIHVPRQENKAADKLASAAAVGEKEGKKSKNKIFTMQVRTDSRAQMLNITRNVKEIVSDSGATTGICTVFVPHTTAGITINENADPDVVHDIISTLNRLVPTDRNYRHMEGNSDAHVKASLMGFSVDVIVDNGSLLLGTWQGIYFCEFDGPRNRYVHVLVK